MNPGALIHVVDDDQSLRTALVRLVRSLGYDVRAFASAEEILQSGAVGQFACIVTAYAISNNIVDIISPHCPWEA